jgi:beta-glucanase (GH16 family)
MLSRTIIIATVLATLIIGGAVAAGVILSANNHDDSTYYDNPNDFTTKSVNDVIGNTTLVNTTQINVNTNGETVSNSTGPAISPDYIVINNTTSNTTHVPIWWDEFDDDSINKKHWTIIDYPGRTGYGNKELQTYQKDNVYVNDGAMHIMAHRDHDDWFSGRVESKGAWTPGMILGDKLVTKIYFESNILIPDSGNGLWPGFWFFPKEYVYGEYAASGEIDVMELHDGYTSLTSGIHYGGPEKKGYDGIKNLRNMTRTSNEDGSSFENKSFVFSVEWTLDTIVFFVNGAETTRRYSKAIDPENGWFSAASNAEISSPFDTPFKAIYNIAVGGNFPQYEPDETTPDEVLMIVDYFRVFADFA